MYSLMVQRKSHPTPYWYPAGIADTRDDEWLAEQQAWWNSRPDTVQTIINEVPGTVAQEEAESAASERHYQAQYAYACGYHD